MSGMPRGQITVSHPAGGLDRGTASRCSRRDRRYLDRVGSGAADFDVTDATDGVRVPPQNPAYRLRRLRLTPEEVRVTTSKPPIGPCGRRATPRSPCSSTKRNIGRPTGGSANASPPRRLTEAGGREAVVWLQDYHLACVPAMLRHARRLFVHQFWHIPWPQADILRLFPPARTLVRALLGNDLLGFQTRPTVAISSRRSAGLCPGKGGIGARPGEIPGQAHRGPRLLILDRRKGVRTLIGTGRRGRDVAENPAQRAAPWRPAAARGRPGRLHQGNSRRFRAIERLLEVHLSTSAGWSCCRSRCPPAEKCRSTWPTRRKWRRSRNR